MTVKLPGTCESCRWSTIRRDDPHVVEQFGYICEIPECRNRVVVHSWTCCAHYEPKPQPVTLEQAMTVLRTLSEGVVFDCGIVLGPATCKYAADLIARYDATKEE